MKQKYIALLLFCGLLCCPHLVWAKEQPLEQTYHAIEYDCHAYAENQNVYNFTYQDGVINIKQNEKYHFLLLDGQYVQVPITIVKDKALVPLSVLTDDMGCRIERKGDTWFLKKGKQKLPISSKNGQIDKSKMLGLRDVMEALGGTVTYTKKGIMPLDNPLIAIDFRKNQYTPAQAEQKAEKVLQSCMMRGRKEGKMVPADMEYRIAQTKIVGDIAGYYLLDGWYPMLLEKSTGNLYVQTQSKEKICIEKIEP